MTVLVKGQKVDLTKTNPAVSQLKIGLGWDVAANKESFDLGVAALLWDANGQLGITQNLVFYNNPSGGQSSVKLTKDNRTGEGVGDDEQLLIDLTKKSLLKLIKCSLLLVSMKELLKIRVSTK